MKKTNKLVKGTIAGALLLTLSGCEVIGLVPMAVYGASLSVGDMVEKREVRAEIQSLEDSGVIPKIDRTDTRSGIDNDNNGIRDDVDAYIEHISNTSNELLVLKRMAQSFQKIQTVEDLRSDAASDINNSLYGSLTCWSIAEHKAGKKNSQDKYQIFKKLSALTANTSERRKRFEEFDREQGSGFSTDCRIEKFQKS